MTDWSLAIDFGTSFTTAAMSADGGAPELVEIDNSRYLPSVVCLDDDGQIVTGRVAVSQAVIFPERAERLPKRALAAGDTIRLGGRDLPTVDLATAVLRRIAGEAIRRHDGTPPSTLTLTHPAGWGPRELGRLHQAAVRAGLPDPRFLPEPVAAAIHYTAANTTEPATTLDATVALYDLGGGTFDTAVLRRTADGYEVCGTPGGDPHFGGEDIDVLLQDLIADHLLADARDAWDALWASDSKRDRRAQAKLRQEITTAKEALSDNPTHTLHIDDYVDGAPEDGIRITRAELERAIDGPLAQTRDELLRTITAAGVDPAKLAAVYLTGGATRIPYVAGLLARTLGRLPTTSGDPKAVVVLGALTTPPEAPRGTAQAVGTGGRPEVAAAPWTADLRILEWSTNTWKQAQVLDGDVIYVHCPAGIFAFDARSGEPLWENLEAVGDPCGRLFVVGDLLISAINPTSGSTSSLPAVWVGNKHSGAKIWRRVLDARRSPFVSSSPVGGLAVDDSKVFVSHGKLTAFALATGDQLWSAETGHPVWGFDGLLRANDRLYIKHTNPGRVSALSPDTGCQVWTREIKDRLTAEEPATDGSRLFVVGRKSVLALDMNSGKILWRVNDYKHLAGGILVGADGHIYVSQYGGWIRRLRADDGTEVHSFSWPDGATHGHACIAAYATESHLYATSTTSLFAFRFDQSTPVWQRAGLGALPSNVAAMHGLLYALDGGELRAIDAVTGNGPRE